MSKGVKKPSGRKIVYFFGLFLVLVWMGVRTSLRTTVSTENLSGAGSGKTQVETDGSTRKKRNVFVDVGGNKGDTLLAFYEKFDRVFEAPNTAAWPGQPTKPSSYEVFVWEPNPKHNEKYDAIAKQYEFTLIHAAATTEDGFTYLDGFGGDNAVGATVLNHKGTSEKTGLKVEQKDFSKWLKEQFTTDDYLICKIDVEGSEYSILPKMIADGTLCLCDRLSVEWHAWIGRRSAREDFHLLHFNSPSKIPDVINVEKCNAHNDCVCWIPGQKVLPFYNCYLPRIVQEARKLCSSSFPLEKLF